MKENRLRKLVAIFEQFQNRRYPVGSKLWPMADRNNKRVCARRRRLLIDSNRLVTKRRANLHVMKNPLVEMPDFSQMVPISMQIVEQVCTNCVSDNVPAE